MADDFQLTDEERQAILAHRRDNTPKRKGTGRYTDPDSGISYEFDLTPDETAKLAGKALKGLFDGDSDDGKGAGDKPDKPKVLKDYFGTRKPAASG